jgi:hypothetical protein
MENKEQVWNKVEEEITEMKEAIGEGIRKIEESLEMFFFQWSLCQVFRVDAEML